MKYATLDKQGKFTGVLYDELTENVKNFHIENGLTYIKVNRDRLEPINEVQDSEDEFSFVEPDYGYPTEEELQADIQDRLKSEGDIYTLNGVDYQIPFMKDDADGLVQVTLGFMKGAFINTTIHFTNGTKLPITVDEFDVFSMWFAEKRNSFFIGE